MLAAYYTSFVLLKDRLSQTHVQIITNFALYFAQRPYNAWVLSLFYSRSTAEVQLSNQFQIVRV